MPAAQWTTEEDKLLRSLVAKYGAKGKWATIAVEAGFGHDSAACEKRYTTLFNPKFDGFAFGGATKGGSVVGHSNTMYTGVPGEGFNLAYYPNAGNPA